MTITLNGTGTIFTNANADIGIGTSSPNTYGTNIRTVDVEGSAGAGIKFGTGTANAYFGAYYLGGSTNTAYVQTFNSSPIVFAVNNAESMRIDSSGNLLVGTTASTGGNNKAAIHFDKNAVNGLSFRQLVNDAGGGQPVVFYNVAGGGIGSITSGASSVAYNTSSDYRLKENVAPLTSGIDIINALNPVAYDWKIDGTKGEGFIAHELQEHIPLAVTGEKDAVDEEGKMKPQAVDYSKIVVHLVAAMQEQQKQINELKNKISILEAK